MSSELVTQIPEDILQNTEKTYSEPIKSSRITNPIARFNLQIDCVHNDFEDIEKAKKINIDECLETVYFLEDFQTKSRFSSRFFNNRFSNKPPLIVLPPYGYSSKNSHFNYFLTLLSSNIERQIIFINYPGSDKSSDLGYFQKLQLLKNSNFKTVTQPILRSLKNIGVYDFDIYGYSMGGRMAASMVSESEELGMHAKNLIMLDPAGVKNINPIDFLSEIPNINLYERFPYDKDQIHACLLDENREDYLLDLYSQFIPSLSKTPSLAVYAISLMRKNLLPDLIKAFSTNNDLKVTLMNASDSSVSPTSDCVRIKSRISELGYDKNKFRNIVFPGEKHMIGLGSKRIVHKINFFLK